jgi:DNA-nicking Smr family endonuclease
MTGRGRKPPLPNDAALWQEVAKTVAPLGRRSPMSADAESPETPARKPMAMTPKGAPTAVPQPRVKPPSPIPPALAPLDRRLRGRLGRGIASIDSRIDLHGLTQAVAHRRLVDFLTGAQAKGARLVLVITGKGRTGDSPHGDDGRGVLRRMVPIWLGAPDLRPVVVGFEGAGRAHGGDGALYVRIRRRKPG